MSQSKEENKKSNSAEKPVEEKVETPEPETPAEVNEETNPKVSLSKQDYDWLKDHLGSVAVSYGDPIEGENPQTALQRDRAFCCQKWVQSKSIK